MGTLATSDFAQIMVQLHTLFQTAKGETAMTVQLYEAISASLRELEEVSNHAMTEEQLELFRTAFSALIKLSNMVRDGE